MYNITTIFAKIVGTNAHKTLPNALFRPPLPHFNVVVWV